MMTHDASPKPANHRAYHAQTDIFMMYMPPKAFMNNSQRPWQASEWQQHLRRYWRAGEAVRLMRRLPQCRSLCSKSHASSATASVSATWTAAVLYLGIFMQL